MTQLKKFRVLMLALSGVALLSACDDGGEETHGTVADFFRLKNNGAASVYLPQRTHSTPTLAGSYLASQFAQYRQDWSVANDYLEQVLAADPTNVTILQRAMVLAIQSGDIDRAIRLARKVLEQDSTHILARMFVASADLASQDYKGATETLADMPRENVGSFIQPILLAWARAPEGYRDDYNLISASPLHAYHALLIADYAGHVKKPETYFANIIASGEVDAHIMEQVGDIFTRAGHTELAKQIYEALLKNASGHTDFEELQAKYDDPAAFAKIPKAIATPEAGAAEAFYNMARILFQDASDDSALVFARLAAYLDPAREDVKIILAGIMMRNDHTDEAIKIFRSVKSHNPIYLDTQRSAAELMEREGKIELSVKFLEDLYKQHNDIQSLVQIGDVYRRDEKHQDAINAYNRAEKALGGEAGEEYWHLLYARGMSYERTGNMPKAEIDLQRALEFKPDHPYLLNYLGYSWADADKNLDQAFEMILKAATLMPDDGYIADSLGWIYYRTGQYAQAIIELEKAVEILPYDPTINDHLGDAYWQVGRKQEARFQWNRALNHSEEEELNVSLREKIANGLAENPPSLAGKDTLRTAAPAPLPPVIPQDSSAPDARIKINP